jgi:hypothetical protein
MVDHGSGQGRRVFETAGVAALRRGFRKPENAGMKREMPFMDGHNLKSLNDTGAITIIKGLNSI